MKLITQRQLIRIVAARWRKAYEPFTDGVPLFSERYGHKHGKSKLQIAEELDAVDGETATHEEIAAIIGNDSWTRMKCDECNRSVDAVLRVGEEPDYESHTAELCRECAAKIAAFEWPND